MIMKKYVTTNDFIDVQYQYSWMWSALQMSLIRTFFSIVLLQQQKPYLDLFKYKLQAFDDFKKKQKNFCSNVF